MRCQLTCVLPKQNIKTLGTWAAGIKVTGIALTNVEIKGNTMVVCKAVQPTFEHKAIDCEPGFQFCINQYGVQYAQCVVDSNLYDVVYTGII